MRGGPPDRPRKRAFRIRSVDRDLDEELAFHFDETVADLERGGLSREQAEAEARRRFGDEARYRSEVARLDREAERMRHRRNRLDAAVHTLQAALRNITRSPGLSVSIVLLLALGLGANATMFSTIDRLMLRAPDHIRDPDAVRRMHVERFLPGSGERRAGLFGYLDLVALGASADLPEVAAYASSTEPLGEGQHTRRVRGWSVTANFWTLLGVRPHLGRFFTPEEDAASGEPVVVLGYDLWRATFGGDSAVLGSTVRLGADTRYTVIGVAPKGFTGVEIEPAEYWVPFHYTTANVIARFAGEGAIGRGLEVSSAVVRLEPGMTAEDVAARATAVYMRARRESGDRGVDRAEPRIVLAPARGPDPVRGSQGFRRSAEDNAVALWLAGISLLVLLIACANVTNLLLARSIRRQRETAIRLALGISRGRIVAQAMAEGLVLAMLGSLAALAFTQWGGWLMQRTLLPDVDWQSPISHRLVLFVLGVTLASGLISALVPALQTRRYAADGVLRNASAVRGATYGTRGALALAQAALSVLLLLGAGLFVRSLGKARAVDFGFDADRVAYLNVWFRNDAMLNAGSPEVEQFMQRAVERLRRLPGIAAVAHGDVPFIGGGTPRLRASGYDSIASPHGGRPYRFRASPDYFRTVGLALLEGRTFDDRDGPVAIVNRTMARALWPDEGAIGRCLYVGDSSTCTTIIGVVSDSRVRNLHSTAFSYYLPPGPDVGFAERPIVRIQADPGRVIPAIQSELMRLDDRVRFVDVLRLDQHIVDAHLRSWKLGAMLFTAFGVLAIIVAMIGLYSVLAFDVEQRRREIGLRTALGATRDGVVARFVVRGLKLTSVGTAAGIIIALVFAPRIEHLLFQTSARDPLTFVTIAAALLAASIAAGALPAWRAASVDPSVVLREE